MTNILKQSWQIYREHFLVILAVVLTVWVPLELLSSYVDAFVYGEEELRKSWNLARFLNNFFGIIATAGVIFVGHEAMTGQKATFRSAIGVGFRSWGRMWWTRFLAGLAIMGGLLLLIVPGVYLLVRLSLVEPVTVQEQISGAAAMRRSLALTSGRFWLVFRLGIVLLGVFILPVALIIGIGIIPGLDHWLIDATTQLVADVAAAFATIALVTTYSNFSNEVPTQGAFQSSLRDAGQSDVKGSVG